MITRTDDPSVFVARCDRCASEIDVNARSHDGGILALGWRYLGSGKHDCNRCVEKHLVVDRR